MNNSSSLYIHIPFCLSKCTYCDFYSIPVHSISDKYIDLLLNEYRTRKEKFNIDKWNTVYIGGGTPSLLTSKQLQKLFSIIVPDTENSEITIETNPDDITEDFLKVISDCGVNRISTGIQCLDDSVLSYVNRRSDVKKCRNAISLIQKNWKHRFSIDMISGLPGLTEKSFLAGLEEVSKSGAEHISLYSLTIEDETPLSKDLKKYSEDENINQWILGRDFLDKNGFNQYEVSNFARQGFESKHNLTYWRKNDYVGIGSGAVGTIGNTRYTNGKLEPCKEINYTTDFSIESLDEKTLEFEFCMMGLRTLKGISVSEFHRRFNKNLIDYLGKSFDKWISKGDAQITKIDDDEWFSLTKKGILYLNIFLEEILSE